MPPRKAKASRRLAVVKEEPMDTSSTHVKEEPLPMVTTTNSSSKRVKEEPHYSPANTSDISSKRAKVSYPDHVILKMALRIQRVWRTNFRFYGTKSYAIGYLEVIPMKHIKSIRFGIDYDISSCIFIAFLTVHHYHTAFKLWWSFSERSMSLRLRKDLSNAFI
jgi:hypothetical protein